MNMLMKEIFTYCDRSARFFSNEDSSVILLRSAFSAFSGETTDSPYIRIRLNLGGGGLVWENQNAIKTAKHWRRGNTMVSLNLSGHVSCPAVEMLGIAINLETWRRDGLTHLCKEDLSASANNPRSDHLITSVLNALWQSAKVHGVNTDFFMHGVNQILDRLASKEFTSTKKALQRPLPNRVLLQVRELIEANLDVKITVSEMATCARMETASFSRAFTRSTGLTPFAYLTDHRMKKAKILIKQGMDITFTSIAVGYNNPSKFAAAFRRFTGKTPSEWRISNINQLP